ncbi:MAG: hypothetical protein ACLGG9_10070 [Thermoleophilia bacterium]
MSDAAPTGGRRRPPPPPRDILSGQVLEDELPDIARPGAPHPPSPGDAGAPRRRPRAGAPAGQLPWQLPWQLAGIVLGAQAAAIADSLDRGIVPPLLVPGAILMEAQLRATALMLRRGS